MKVEWEAGSFFYKSRLWSVATMWEYITVPLQILLGTGYVLLIHWDQTRNGGHSAPIKVVIIAFQQLFLGVLVLLALWQSQHWDVKATGRFLYYFTVTRSREIFRMMVPALIIVGVNSLRLLAITLVPVPVYAITNQSGMLLSAIASYFYLRRQFLARQWLGLACLMAGIAIVILSSRGSHTHLGQHDFSGHHDWHNEAGEPLAPDGTLATESVSGLYTNWLHSDFVNVTTWIGPMIQISGGSPEVSGLVPGSTASAVNSSVALLVGEGTGEGEGGEEVLLEKTDEAQDSYVLGVVLLLVAEIASSLGHVYVESVFRLGLSMTSEDHKRLEVRRQQHPGWSYRRTLRHLLQFDYHTQMDLLLRGCHVVVWGLLFSLIVAWVGDYKRLLAEGPVQSFSVLTWVVTLWGPLGLMVSSVNIKRYGSVAKSIFNVLTVLLTCAFSVLWFDFQLTWWFSLGLGLVFLGLGLYFYHIDSVPASTTRVRKRLPSVST